VKIIVELAKNKIILSDILQFYNYGMYDLNRILELTKKNNRGFGVRISHIQEYLRIILAENERDVSYKIPIPNIPKYLKKDKHLRFIKRVVKNPALLTQIKQYWAIGFTNYHCIYDFMEENISLPTLKAWKATGLHEWDIRDYIYKGLISVSQIQEYLDVGVKIDDINWYLSRPVQHHVPLKIIKKYFKNGIYDKFLIKSHYVHHRNISISEIKEFLDIGEDDPLTYLEKNIRASDVEKYFKVGIKDSEYIIHFIEKGITPEDASENI
jgi:hypothetical protein